MGKPGRRRPAGVDGWTTGRWGWKEGGVGVEGWIGSEQIDGLMKRWWEIIGCKARGEIKRHVNNPGEG